MPLADDYAFQKLAVRVRTASPMRDPVITMQTDSDVASAAVCDRHIFVIVIDQKLIGAIATSADDEIKDVERNHAAAIGPDVGLHTFLLSLTAAENPS